MELITRPRTERRGFWIAVTILCTIAAAAAIRRLIALAGSPASGPSEFAALDAVFEAKPDLTRVHVLVGLALALAIPVQLSSRIRSRYPLVHRWLGRALVVVGIVVGISGYALLLSPVGGWLEASAIILYGTAFLGALLVAWRHIRRGNVPRHREWMLRAIGIVLGIAAARPVMAVFFATSPLTNLKPPQFFGAAMWIGFTSTTLAAEWYVRRTRYQLEEQ